MTETQYLNSDIKYNLMRLNKQPAKTLTHKMYCLPKNIDNQIVKHMTGIQSTICFSTLKPKTTQIQFSLSDGNLWLKLFLQTGGFPTTPSHDPHLFMWVRGSSETANGVLLGAVASVGQKINTKTNPLSCMKENAFSPKLNWSYKRWMHQIMKPIKSEFNRIL